jgi:hypothetical protein
VLPGDADDRVVRRCRSIARCAPAVCRSPDFVTSSIHQMNAAGDEMSLNRDGALNRSDFVKSAASAAIAAGLAAAVRQADGFETKPATQRLLFGRLRFGQRRVHRPHGREHTQFRLNPESERSNLPENPAGTGRSACPASHRLLRPFSLSIGAMVWVYISEVFRKSPSQSARALGAWPTGRGMR